MFKKPGISAERCLWALREADGSVARAMELLHQRGTVTAAPEYGTALTKELAKIPGFAEGYEAAKRQQIFGRQLRELREDSGLSQARLAKLSGIDQYAISRFEAGKCTISIEMLERIVHVLGGSPR